MRVFFIESFWLVSRHYTAWTKNAKLIFGARLSTQGQGGESACVTTVVLLLFPSGLFETTTIIPLFTDEGVLALQALLRLGLSGSSK